MRLNTFIKGFLRAGVWKSRGFGEALGRKKEQGRRKDRPGRNGMEMAEAGGQVSADGGEAADRREVADGGEEKDGKSIDGGEGNGGRGTDGGEGKNSAEIGEGEGGASKDRTAQEMAQGVALSEREIERFLQYMQEREMSPATIRKYRHDVGELLLHLTGGGSEGCEGKGAGLQALDARLGEGQAGGRAFLRDKNELIRFKEALQERGLAKTTVNGKIAAVNCFLRFAGKEGWKLKALKIQREIFKERGAWVSEEEYRRMVDKARQEGDERLAMLLQTLASVGIRVSELPFITVESLLRGRAEICNKAKIRTILYPKGLAEKLLEYCESKGIREGSVFVTRNGKALDRSYVWRTLKRCAASSGVEEGKVFPHAFRHMFALAYYREHKDIVRLADILGHSSVNTTRIYTLWDGEEQRKQMEDLHLLV